MARLKNRQTQIPNGLRFRIQQLNYTSAPFSSFDVIVNSVKQLADGNPQLFHQNGWPTERPAIADWVDEFNAGICKANQWNDYIVETPDISPPKFPPPPSSRHPAGAVAAGVVSLAEWFGEGAQPVERNLAEKRAQVCSKCPLNKKGDYGNWFTKAVAEGIRNMAGAFRGLKINTVHDEQLGVCEACMCPMKLKVHVPLKHILSNTDKETMDAFDSNCWILSESKMGSLLPK